MCVGSEEGANRTSSRALNGVGLTSQRSKMESNPNSQLAGSEGVYPEQKHFKTGSDWLASLFWVTMRLSALSALFMISCATPTCPPLTAIMSAVPPPLFRTLSKHLSCVNLPWVRACLWHSSRNLTTRVCPLSLAHINGV